MRTGGYTIQHTLTPEAANIVKQALVLARRRGHAQVTPLHVANAMLTSPTSLFRKACLQPNSHPLHCKALELCFNVALNRLPTTQSNPVMLNPNQSNHPSLSNALVAAFKRAQAHQRRGSIENQHQPILALKVEIEQLAISILDDPSVSRVMREAGFSSTQVKDNIEQMEISVSSPNPLNFSQSKENINPKSLSKVQDEDVMSVIEMMMTRKRKNIVIIRECLASADAIVKGVIEKFETKNNINLRFMQFVSLPLQSLNHLSREDVQDKVRELKCLVKSFVGRGVILYLGDLKWVSNYWSGHSERKRNGSYYYSPMEHMIMELSGLMFGVDIGKLWLMGIASSETFMRCKTGHPSLETLWDLCPLTLPVATLDLTLNLEGNDSENEKNLLSCCGECSVNLTREARTIMSYGRTSESTLPTWLQQYKEENTRQTNNAQECEKFGNVCNKWSSAYSSLPKHHLTWPVFESNIPKEHQFFMGGECFEEPSQKTLMPELLSNPNSSPNSASCSEASEQDYDHDDDQHQYSLHKFKEMNIENVKVLTNALERVVPWQREIIPDIVNTVLQCRSGRMERKGKQETWLSFFGADNHAKEKIARELAKVVFGSRNNFVQMGLSRFSATRADSTDDDQEFVSNKRARDESGQSYLERFTEAIQEDTHRVFFMEDVEQVDYHSQMGIKKAIKNGSITLNGAETVLLKDAIVIFSCESFSSISRACSPSVSPKYSENGQETVEDDGKEPMINLDLNIATQDHRSSHEDKSVFDFGILDSVDNQVIFKLQML
ncbi:putative Clp, repeat (R) domain, Clp domain superfamily protein [Helianthus annuus]|nr:putative Clp, repeat (R) domain, Clp domain superfamily protein [Helianthus annuus]KAJ0683799.1 putative Clp, repeat (R) domain, Clp domain superfamily protein [Helianthus annuus]KAJ0687763.1 putative Clp, repeat (R) domain, Clp domain superfamily protein [Helianthus annuus]KAJ0873335.1 putative Clp domain superfamily protein [Helianthus annuus]